MKKLLCVLGFMMFLFGCEQVNYSYNYLMENPDVLQKEFMQCQNFGTNTNVPCAMVLQAGKDFQMLADSRANDPLQFGQTILKTQFDLSQAKTAQERENLKQKVKILYAVIRATSRGN